MQLRQQIIALFINVIIVFQPVIPFLEYEVFHDYIVKHLCVNRDVPGSCCEGKCYLEKSLNKAGAGATSDKENKAPEKRIQQFESNLPKEKINMGCFFNLPVSFADICVPYTFQNCEEFFHPPCIQLNISVG